MTTASTPAPHRTGCPAWLAAGLIVLAVVATWWTSLAAPFVLDDHDSILNNGTIRRFPSLDWMRPPATGGETVSGRPILNLSFAIDYALHGLDARGFRVTNVLIHAAAALVLFGLVRRTLIRAKESDSVARWTALAIALIWALHPLQTAAVTYVVQRAESLAGLLGLLALYGFVRATAPAGELRESARRLWAVGSVLACFLGVGTKETVAVVPIIILLYDRALVAGSLRAAWQQHGRLHAALFASWIPLVGLMVANRGRGGSAGFETEIGVVTYFLTQCEAIVRYGRLAFWPVGQVFDYGTPTIASVSEVWMQLALLLAAGGAVLWCLMRNRVAGLWGACFFLLLAPSSSFVPVATQTMAEHRMYLTLAALLALAAAGVRSLPLSSSGRALLAFFVIALCSAATVMRNDVYRSEVTLWADTVEKRPENARAQHNLGRALGAAGETGRAMAAFRRAIALQPNHAFAHFSLGKLLASRGEWKEARLHLEAASDAAPQYADAAIGLGTVLMQLGEIDAARERFEAALRNDPLSREARTSLAAVAIKQGRFDEAERDLAEVLRVEPAFGLARYQMGLLREKQQDAAAAEREFREALAHDPRLAAAQLALGNLLARASDFARAESAYRAASEIAPSAEVYFVWGNLLARSRRVEEAIARYRMALGMDANHVRARNNLANALLMLRRFEEAAREYEEVLSRDPENAVVRENLSQVRQYQRATQ